jgi:hypothetical protein
MKRYLFMLFSIILLLVPVLGFFHPGLPKTHDGKDHVARIANFYQSLSEGNIIPRWAPNLNWGYGHPVLMFLYPLPSYFASLFHFLGFSLVDSVKAVFVIGMVLSAVFMYLWLSSFLSRVASFLGAFWYLYAPYRFVDVYVRGDIGENLAFVFLPLSLFSIHKLFERQEKKYLLLLSFSIASLILSHNALSLMFLPFIFFYTGFIFWRSGFNRRFFLFASFAIILGFGLSAFFWIPGLLEGKYTLRNIVTKGGYIGRFVSFTDLIYGDWNYGISGSFTVQLGFVSWVAMLSLPVLLLLARKDKNEFIFIMALIFYLAVSVFLMLPVSNFIWSSIVLLQNFQFPWRFLAVAVFSSSVLIALLISKIRPSAGVISAIFLIVITLFLQKNFWQANSYWYFSDAFFKGVYKGTTDTGESAPIWSVRFMEKEPRSHIEVIGGVAEIKEVKRLSNYHSYKIVGKTDKVRIRENTLYFPGWQVFSDGKRIPVEFQDPANRGLITFYLDKSEHTVEIKFEETKLRKAADIISLISVFIILMLVFSAKFNLS